MRYRAKLVNREGKTVYRTVPLTKKRAIARAQARKDFWGEFDADIILERYAE